jgi:hypothetical protein
MQLKKNWASQYLHIAAAAMATANTGKEYEVK